MNISPKLKRIKGSNMLTLSKLTLRDALLIKSKPLGDHRGCFARLFCQKELGEILGNKTIVQSNYSFSKVKGTIRGLHYQTAPAAEIKFVRCIQGSFFDVIVDLRYDSPTFLLWHGETLKAGDLKMVMVPEGFAHGLQTLEDDSAAMYLHTDYYTPEYEGGVRFNDPKINIKWPLSPAEVSEKDQNQQLIPNDYKGISL